jgi:predicted enzyme related to lactoylglutathione lyase
MANRSIVHLEIPAKDRNTAATFYKELFAGNTSIWAPMNYDVQGNGARRLPDVSEIVRRVACCLHRQRRIDADLK